MEPAARTVASGPEWQMRAGGAWMGSLWEPTGRQRPRRRQIVPYRGGGGDLCPRASEGTARGSFADLWAQPAVYIPGGWARRGPVRLPMPSGVRVE